MQQHKVESKTKLEYLDIQNNSKKAFVLLHGYGASMYDLFGLNDFLTNKDTFDWYFPNAPLELMPGQLMGRAWFPINVEELELAMQQGEHRKFADKDPEEFQHAIELVERFCESLLSDYDEIIIGGFSQGAMVSTHVCLRNNISFKKLVVFSGTLIAEQSLLEYDSKLNIPFFQSHGTHDPILEYGQAKNLFEALKLSGLTGEFVSFQGAHEIPMEVLRKWNDFINKD